MLAASRFVAAVLLASAACAVVSSSRPNVHNCTLTWFEQTVNHFGFAAVPGNAAGTYKQRVFSYGEYWGQGGCPATPGPIFFYTGASLTCVCTGVVMVCLWRGRRLCLSVGL